jgi:lipid II:glycine glycyltransferase (peptidoglycan interpeptide bridge formation enzyme)
MFSRENMLETSLFFTCLFSPLSIAYLAVYTKDMNQVEQSTNQAEWDDYIVDHGGHPLQLWEWGEVKARHNWQVERVFVRDGDMTIGAAQLLIRHLPWPLRSMVYIPRGPVVSQDNRAAVLETLAAYAKRSLDAINLTIEPHWREWPSDTKGWRVSTNTILIPRTLILDLAHTPDELMAAMAKKTRQYIRKSGKEGIELRRLTTHEELADCLEIYRQTAQRAGFPLHDDAYYYDIFDQMGDYSPVFAAYENGEMLTFLWLAISGDIAFELYGGMNDRGQELRANYALKWHAITTMKQWGLSEYDMNGLLNDGVSTFKQGFADHEDMLVGTYDKPLSPLYFVWDKGLPYAKKAIRLIKQRIR